MECHTVPQQPVAGHLVENQHQIFQLIKECIYNTPLSIVQHLQEKAEWLFVCRNKRNIDAIMGVGCSNSLKHKVSLLALMVL